MSASPKPVKDDPIVRAFELERALKEMDQLLSEVRAAPQTGGPPTPPADDDERPKTIHNERVKLTATLLNGIALGFIVGGAVTTIAGLGTLSNPNDQLIRALAWIMGGVIVHLIAWLSLGTLL